MELQIVLLAYIVGICSGLREVHVQVPTAVKKGDSTVLSCYYDLEGDALYAVKWYWEGQEFYRYAPNEQPAIKTFLIRSLRVNINESNATQVTLTELKSDSTGIYSCEVSADAPSFYTAIAFAVMNVVELPAQRPLIHGLKTKYRIGDVLRGNCTSDRSIPAANLTWYINDRQPLQSYVRFYSLVDTNDAPWQTSIIGLHLLVTPNHFASGKLKVRCIASIYDIYWQSTEISAKEDRSRAIHFEPAATKVQGNDYLQPPPNFQTGQRKPDGEVDVKVIGSSSGLKPSMQRYVLELFLILQLVVY